MYRIHYMPRPTHRLKFAVLATDTVLLTVEKGDVRVLLIQVHRPPFYTHHWGVPGGLIHPRETADAAGIRHLREKGGVRGVFMEQLYTFSRVDRDPRGRVVSVAYLALIPHTNVRPPKDPNVRWFSVKHLPRLAYDHAQVIRTAFERLRTKLEYTNIAFTLLPLEFTMGELQAVYETVFARRFDKRNFRKKIFALKLVRPTGRKKKGFAGRPAALYRFIERKPRTVEIL